MTAPEPTSDRRGLTLTLDEIHAAFRAKRIDGETAVRRMQAADPRLGEFGAKNLLKSERLPSERYAAALIAPYGGAS